MICGSFRNNARTYGWSTSLREPRDAEPGARGKRPTAVPLGSRRSVRAGARIALRWADQRWKRLENEEQAFALESTDGLVARNEDRKVRRQAHDRPDADGTHSLVSR